VISGKTVLIAHIGYPTEAFKAPMISNPWFDSTPPAGKRAGHDVAVNATPLGMQDGEPLPFDMSRVSPATLIGEVVMRQAITPLLAAAQAKGCPIQVGTDMLFEMIPAYLEFFGFGIATPEELRTVSRIRY
jgi:shikimate 5-dehydrogenase